MKIHLPTQRLIINDLLDSDHPFILELLNTKGWLEFIGDRKVHTEEDAKAYIQKIKNTENLDYWVVRTQAQNQPIGVVSYLKRAYLEHYDLGFAFLPAYMGQGYAHEASKAVLGEIQAQLPAPIQACLLPHNTPSLKLLGRLGFVFEKNIEVDGAPMLVYVKA
jgi:[ribosomal protein S5]-alanine N-acetyltransferase